MRFRVSYEGEEPRYVHKTRRGYVFGASLSEPHTSKSNGAIIIYLVYVVP